MNNINMFLEFLVPDEDKFSSFREFAQENSVPIIRPTVQKLLEVIIGIKKPVKVLEIGTAIGFSAVVMYDAMKKYTTSPVIKTIENYDKRITIARENLKNYVGIELIEGNAYKEITSLNESFDFIFLDGPKGQYISYLPILYKLLDDEGILMVDNVIQDGDVTKSRYLIDRRDRTIHKRMREFLYTITHNKNLQTTVLPLADGVAICRKIEREQNDE